MDTIIANTPQQSRRLPRWLTLAALGILLYACMEATFGTGFATRHATHDVVAIWPAAGITAFMALRFGPVAAWVMFPAFLLQTISVLGWNWSYVGTSVANTLAPIIAAGLYRRAGGLAYPLQDVRSTALFVILLAIAHSSLAATMGSASLILGGDLPNAALGFVWWRWALSDTAGVILCGPALIALLHHLDSGSIRRHINRLLPLVVGCGLALWLLPALLVEYVDKVLAPMFALPILVWIAFWKQRRYTPLIMSTVVGLAILISLDLGRAYTATDILRAQIYGVLTLTAVLFLYVVDGVRRAVVCELEAERAQLEREVARRTRELDKMSMLARYTDHPVVLVGTQKNVEWINPGFTRLFGYRPDEVVDKPVHVLAGPEQDPEHIAALTTSVSDGQSYSAETALSTKSGEVVQIALSVTPVLDADGNHQRSVVLLRDITEELARKQEIQDREAYFRAIFEGSALPIVIYDQQGTIQQFNNAAEKFYGFANEEAVNKNIDMLVPPDERQRHSDDVLNAGMDSPLLGQQIEGAGVHRSGELLPIRLSLGEVRLANGSMLFAAMVHDLTEIKALEQDLVQAKKLEAIGELASGIAHEINTPIQFICDNTTFVGESFKSLQPTLEAVRALHRDHHASAAIPSHLTGDLLGGMDPADLDFLIDEIPAAISQSKEGLSRVSDIVSAMKSFSHSTVEKVATDLNEAVESSVIVSRNEWKYVADLRKCLGAGLPELMCVASEIKQVIVILLVNAAQAIEDKLAGDDADADFSGSAAGAPAHRLGIIEVTTRQRGDSLQIIVSDTGGGIPEQIKARIFDPFFTTKEVGRGSGQGLSIAYNVICNKHGGSIEVEDNEVGGSRFVVTLPIAASQTQNCEPVAAIGA